MAERVELARIRTDGGCQPRSTMLFDVVEDYANEMARGAEFPAVIVFYDGADYWLADGYHRRQAAETLGLVDIAADVRQGTRRDAILFSVGANAAHGMRRTNEDKRRAVITLLGDPEWSRWNNSEIARRCNVVEGVVRKLRPPPPSSHDTKMPEERLVTRNGATYTMNTANIGRGDRPAALAYPDDEPPLFDGTHFAERDPSYQNGTTNGAATPPPTVDLTNNHLCHALSEALQAIKSLPSPEETAARFPRALEHSIRAEEVTEACRWLAEFAVLWAKGQNQRDERKAAMLQRAKEIMGHVPV